MRRHGGSIVAGIGLIGVVTGTLAGPVLGSRLGDQVQGRSTHQTFKWSRLDEQTSSKTFRRMRHLGAGVTNAGATTVVLSGTVEGGAIDVRVLSVSDIGERRILRPGFARIRGGELRSFSHVFGRREGAGTCRNYVVQWRSLSGREVTLERGSLLVHHHSPRDVACT